MQDADLILREVNSSRRASLAIKLAWLQFLPKACEASLALRQSTPRNFDTLLSGRRDQQTRRPRLPRSHRHFSLCYLSPMLACN